MNLLRLIPAMATHRGMRRRLNEDSVGYRYPRDRDVLLEQGALFIVADGVGGLAEGDKASEMAVDRLLVHYYASSSTPTSTEEHLVNAVQAVNADIVQRLKRQAATTVVAAVIVQDRYIIASVGDSLAFLVQDASIRQLTQEDVLVAEGEKSGPLTKAVGFRDSLEVNIVAGTLQVGEKLLLCSDGLTRYLQPDDLVRYSGVRNPRDGVRRMIAEANNRGGADNISTILIAVGEPLEENAIRQHVDNLVVPVSIDALPMMHPDVPTKPDTQLPQARIETALEQYARNTTAESTSSRQPATATPSAATPVPAVPSAQQSSPLSTRILLATSGIVLIIGVLFIGFALFATLGNATEPNDAIITEPAAVETALPTDALTADPEALQVGDRIVLAESRPLVVRVGDSVGAFVALPETPYLIDDIFEDDQGRLWYRLLEDETENTGWISATDLPTVRLSPAS